MIWRDPRVDVDQQLGADAARSGRPLRRADDHRLARDPRADVDQQLGADPATSGRLLHRAGDHGLSAITAGPRSLGWTLIASWAQTRPHLAALAPSRRSWAGARTLGWTLISSWAQMRPDLAASCAEPTIMTGGRWRLAAIMPRPLRSRPDRVLLDDVRVSGSGAAASPRTPPTPPHPPALTRWPRSTRLHGPAARAELCPGTRPAAV
jgi:hypothetical protein